MLRVKAYIVFPVESPNTHGCMLVLHESASKAKTMGLNGIYGAPVKYIDMRARRMPEYDHISSTPRQFKKNLDLPNNVNRFYLEK